MIQVLAQSRMRRLALRVSLFMLLCGPLAEAAFAQSDSKVEIRSVRVGFNQRLKLGTWTPVVVELGNSGPDDTVVVVAPDADGNTVQIPLSSAPGSPGRFEGLVQIGRPDGALDVSVQSGGQPVASTQLSASLTGDAHVDVYRLQTEFWVGLNVQNGFDKAALADAPQSSSGRELPDDGALFLPLNWTQLPTNPDGWDAINVIILSGESLAPSAETDAILRTWVRRGGRLVVLLGEGTETYLAGPISKWSPVEVLGPHPPVSRFDPINSLIPGSYRLPPLGIGNAVAGARLAGPAIGTYGGPVVARSDYGTGTVTAFALDFDHRPLSNWESLPQLSRLLARPENFAVQKSRRDSELQSTGVTDLNTQLLSSLDQFPEVNRHSFREVLLWTLLWMVIIGPVDYLIVHRVVRRPELTWFTLPVWIAVATFAGARSASASNSHPLTANQIDIVDLSPDLQSLRGRSWMTFYSDATARYSVTAEGTLKGDAATLCWTAKPEEGLRGLYRQGGIAFSSPGYSLNANRTEIESLPVRNWSTAAVSAAWEHSDPSLEALAESQLRDVGTDRLRGAITHRFDDPLTDWFVLYRSFVFYPQAPAGSISPPVWPANEPWVIDASTPHTLITGFLTGRREVFREDVLQKRESVTIQSDTYDPLERSPLRFLRTISFHALAGGPNFTGLTNSALGKLDLSRILEMPHGTPQHAVLFARLRSPATRFNIDGQPITPVDHWTVVRATLKVERGTRPSPASTP